LRLARAAVLRGIPRHTECADRHIRRSGKTAGSPMQFGRGRVKELLLLCQRHNFLWFLIFLLKSDHLRQTAEQKPQSVMPSNSIAIGSISGYVKFYDLILF
jgi:hypothetical protein